MAVMRDLTEQGHEALTVERIILARETLTAAFVAFLNGLPGAIQQGDPASVMSEAKRNLTALVVSLHGEAEWERVLASNE